MIGRDEKTNSKILINPLMILKQINIKNLLSTLICFKIKKTKKKEVVLIFKTLSSNLITELTFYKF